MDGYLPVASGRVGSGLLQDIQLRREYADVQSQVLCVADSGDRDQCKFGGGFTAESGVLIREGGIMKKLISWENR